MEFRILGSIEAVGDEGPLPLGAPKQRALLALLLLNANAVVSRDRLVDALWGAEPPKSAVSSLQVYVHGLRRVLGGERIERHGTGYRLRLDPVELDLGRFERLVDSAAAALGAGRPAEAAEDLRRTLELWTGAPLADLAGEPVHEAEAPQLEERRLRALELRNDAELELGRHDELVPELERLISTEPYRERLRVQHALALYRSGRQVDALAACRAARELLVEELGIDPGPELQELERRILRHDPSLAAPDAPTPALLRLPTPPTPLVGRRLEVAAVCALLRRQEVRLVTLTGPGGAGKTRLALAAAAELGPGLANGAVFVDLAPVRDAALFASVLAQALGAGESSEAMEDMLAAGLRDKSMLLLLDNLEQLVPHVELISHLLSAAPRLLVLATSRTPLRLAGEHEYPVPPLALPEPAATSFEQLVANDAVRLFAARAGAVDPEFQLDEGNAAEVAEVCARLDGLPLAIELAAARSKLLPPGTMNRRLDRALDLLVGGPQDLPGRQRTLRATLEWSHGLLDDAESTLFSRLAVFTGGWTLEAAEAVCGEHRLDVFETLASLVDESLVRPVRRPTGAPRFRMLETIREYAGELLEAAGEEESLRRRHCEHYLARAEKASAAWHAGADPEDSIFPVLDEELDNVRAALAWAAESGEIELEVRLAVAARWYWVLKGHLSEGHRVFDGIVSRLAGAPAEARALALVTGAIFPFRQGDTERAKEWLQVSLDLYRELGDEEGIARGIAEVGSIAIAEQDLDRAAALYEEAVPLFRSQGKLSRVGASLGNLGTIAHMRGDFPTAVRYYAEAIDASREAGDEDGAAVNLHNLGRAELALGRTEQGLEALRESLAIARRLGYREVIAYCLAGLAELAMLENEAARAATMLGASGGLFAEIGASLSPDEAQTRERVTAYVCAELGAERAEELRGEGAAMALDELLDDVASGS